MTAERDLVPREVAALAPVTSGVGSLAAAGLTWTVDTEEWWPETGRIRMGYSTRGRRGGKQPHKLDHYRLTSPRRDAIEEMAARYGGKVEPWPKEEAPYGIAQWQLVVTADWLDVMVPEYRAGGSVYELWEQEGGQGAPVASRRCDGATEQRTGQPCLCLAEGVFEAAADAEGDEDEYVAHAPTVRACKRTTRVALLLTHAKADLGVWRLQTTGKTAGNQLLTVLRFWLPRMEPYARLQLGITTVPRPYRDPQGTPRIALVHVPTFRPDPATGKTSGDLLAGPPSAGVPAVVAEVATRAAAIQPAAPPGPDAAPPSGVGPGPGDQPAAAAVTDAPPTGEDTPPPPEPGQRRPEVKADAGRPEHSSPPHPPGRPEDGPVVAACMHAGLALGVARLYLTKQLPALFGIEHGQHPLPTIGELATIPGDPGDRRSLAWAALQALTGQFTGMDWPPLAEGA